MHLGRARAIESAHTSHTVINTQYPFSELIRWFKRWILQSNPSTAVTDHKDSEIQRTRFNCKILFKPAVTHKQQPHTTSENYLTVVPQLSSSSFSRISFDILWLILASDNKANGFTFCVLHRPQYTTTEQWANYFLGFVVVPLDRSRRLPTQNWWICPN